MTTYLHFPPLLSPAARCSYCSLCSFCGQATWGQDNVRDANTCAENRSVSRETQRSRPTQITLRHGTWKARWKCWQIRLWSLKIKSYNSANSNSCIVERYTFTILWLEEKKERICQLTSHEGHELMIATTFPTITDNIIIVSTTITTI